MPLQNVSGGHSALDVEDGADDDDDQRVVETDPTGRFERYAVSLGKGAYKEVYKAFDQEEGVEVAWNQLKLDNLNKRDAQRILSEIQILQSLQNENIINFIHSWSSPVVSEKDGRVTGERVCFITELMTSGTLKNYIRKTKGPVKPKVLKNWCRQVLSGLHYLHTRNPPIIHRDLKCDNIFINGNNGQAKIGDLGLATVKDRDHVSSVLGTPEFMAPELYDENYTESVDIYAFGLCILEIVTKEYPYSECTNQAQIYKKVTMGIKPAALQKIESEEIRDFITLCIQSDPQKRPSAVELLKNSFLQIQPNSSVHLSAMDLSLDAAVSGTHPEEASEQKLPTPTSIEQVKDAPDPKRLSGLGSGAVASTTKVDADNHTYVILQRSAAGAPKPGTYASVAAAGNAVISNSQAKISSVMVDILDRPNENEVQLKMVYAAAGRASKDIKFPFSLLDDTATDVVAEMVRENLIEGPDEQLARRKLEEAVKNVFLRQQREGGWRGPSPTNSERGVSSTSSGGEPRSMEFHPGGGGPHVSFAPGTAGEGGRRPSFNLPRTPSQSSLAEQAGLRRTVGSASTGALGNMSNVPSSANSTYSTSSSASSRPSTPPVILYPQGPRPPTPGMFSS
ncbi:kinase-like domain-containing protein [Cladochytrium replicatum]|nr:kinase-like domain-containing protein [Cladochytrium replicatum]